MTKSYNTEKLFRSANWFNRQKITLFTGSIVLILGAIFPWYRLPTEALETFGTNLFWGNLFRIMAALFAIIGFIFTFWLPINRTPRLCFWGIFIVILLIPYIIVNWFPNANFLAQTYYKQGEKIAEHVEKNYSEVQAVWKQNIFLDKPVAIMPISDLSITNSRFFQLSSWDSVFTEWLGYSNGLFQFIGSGWSFTLIGVVICLFAFYIKLEGENINLLIKDMKKFIPGVSLLLVLIFYSIIFMNIINHQLDMMFAKGEYSQVVEISRKLSYWYPQLNSDEIFLQHFAKAGFYDQKPDIALIDFTKGLELYRQEDFQKAAEYFNKSLAIQPSRYLVRGYLANAILNQGVNYFNDPNSKKSGAAIDSFKEVLRIFPSNLEALYNLMLACAVNGEFENSAKIAQQIIDVQQYFQQPKDVLLGQAYLHTAWNSYHNSDMAHAWKHYRQSIDSSYWKKSNEAE